MPKFPESYKIIIKAFVIPYNGIVHLVFAELHLYGAIVFVYGGIVNVYGGKSHVYEGVVFVYRGTVHIYGGVKIKMPWEQTSKSAGKRGEKGIAFPCNGKFYFNNPIEYYEWQPANRYPDFKERHRYILN